MKEIKLTRGKVAIVDAEDHAWLSKHTWYCTAQGYAVRDLWDKETRRTSTLFMHKAITPHNDQVDHVNQNKLDNRRVNLRRANHVFNCRNKGKQSNNTSGYKGVSWSKVSHKWSSEINSYGKKYYLGLFEDKVDAARFYNFWANDIHGEYAYLNRINGKKQKVIKHG